MPRSVLPSKGSARSARPSRRRECDPLPPSPPRPPAHRAGRNPRREWKERASRRGSPRALEGGHNLTIPALDVVDRLLARDLFGAPRDQWVPEAGASNGEADEPRYCGCGLEPFMNLSVIFSAPEDDATDSVPSAPPCGGADLFPILPTVEALDLPTIGPTPRTLNVLHPPPPAP